MEVSNTKGAVILRKKLKETRTAEGLRQTQIAEYLNMAVTSYQRLEAGTRGTSEENWLKLFALFNGKVPLDQLMMSE